MKILQINNQHCPKGGAHTVYLNTAELLRQSGHEVFFFALKDAKIMPYEYSNFFPEEIEYRKLSTISKIRNVKSFIYNKEAYQKLCKFIKIIKPDIAHVHLFMGGLTLSILEVLHKNNIPIVHTIHDYRLICPAYTFLDKNNNLCEQCKDGFFIRCAYKRCSLDGNFAHSAILALDAYYRKYIVNPLDLIDHYIFVSNFSLRKHTQFSNVFSTKSSVIYNFRAGKINNTIKRGDYFLFYGRLSREKGIDLLIKTSKKLKCKLKIVGTGPLLQDLIKESDDLVEVLGYKKGEELWNLLQSSSFVIVPSEWYENNPLTIVESFSFGKPVIGSNIGGITELLHDGRGFLFEPKNPDSLALAIKKALALTNLEYEKMSHEVTEFAKNNFSEEAHLNSLINTYNSVINA